MLIEPDPLTLPAIEDIIQLANIAHSGQKDKGGHPYILHVLRVMLKQTHPVCRIIALLHDIVEDTDCTLEDLRNVHKLPEVIVNGVDSLTRRGEPYNVYIERVALNPWAIPVKIADLMDNMDVSRLPNNGVMSGQDIDRNDRYIRAFQRLMHGRSTTDLVQIAPAI